MYTLDVGDSVKNPHVYFDVPLGSLPAETVRTVAAATKHKPGVANREHTPDMHVW